MSLNLNVVNADGSIGTITIPDQEPNAPPRQRPKSSVISAAEFQARFTDGEQLAIAGAVRSSDQLFAVYTRGLTAGHVDLKAAETKAWLDALVGIGAITADRETEILTP